ncbi:MAG: STAS domain-containing protein [Magnetococcales bacterium]|nr:STAS domain-containing protein [Magnetococcales bacterium]
MIDFSIDKLNSTGTMKLSGDLSVQNAATLKEALLDGLNSSETLVIDFAKVERMDLSTVQLLCATHRAINESNKNLVIAGTIPAIVKETILEAGYTSCMGDDDMSGLWTKESN